MTDNYDYSILSGMTLIESMRSGGYKNTAYAIAELVDNSVEAKSKSVEILCSNEFNNTQNNSELRQIAVLDDGEGMSPEILRRSLKYGDGNRSKNSKGIGKFGMGLPNSSLSQCRRVDVYSWKNSLIPFHTYLDLDKMQSDNLVVPEPTQSKIPPRWINSSDSFSKESGTLVIWSKLDKCHWKQAKTLFAHSEFLIGRLYRKFIMNDQLKITMISFTANDDIVIDKKSKRIVQNDPLYLMMPSSTPKPWNDKAMFQKDVNSNIEIEIDHDGKKHKIKMTYSLVRNEVRANGDVGGTLYGKHASKNQGVSIIRADREMDLDQSLAISYEPTERWWGVEIEIPTSLDDVIGLTNNKQSATNISEIMAIISHEIKGEESIDFYSNFDNNPTQLQLYDMIKDINGRIRSMRNRNKTQQKGMRTKSEPGTIRTKPDMAAVIESERGYKGESDKQKEKENESQRIDVLTKIFRDEGATEEEAKEEAKDYVADNKKFHFVVDELSGYQFFDVVTKSGIIIITMNSKHPAYKYLIEITDTNESMKDLSFEKRLKLTKDGLELLIASWARYEDLISNPEKKTDVQNMRIEWGKHLSLYLDQNNSN